MRSETLITREDHSNRPDGHIWTQTEAQRDNGDRKGTYKHSTDNAAKTNEWRKKKKKKIGITVQSFSRNLAENFVIYSKLNCQYSNDSPFLGAMLFRLHFNFLATLVALHFTPVSE